MITLDHLTLKELEGVLPQFSKEKLIALNKSSLISLPEGYRFRQVQLIPRPIDDVFKFFSEEGNLERITPELLNFHVVGKSTDLVQEGTIIDYKLKVHGVPLKWKSVITNWNPPYRFVDHQESGPYKKWHHTHLFIPYGDETLIIDEVYFILPLGMIGKIFAGSFVTKDVSSIFDYRYRAIKELI